MFPVTTTHGSRSDLFHPPLSPPLGGTQASRATREASHQSLMDLLQGAEVRATMERASSDLPPDSLAHQVCPLYPVFPLQRSTQE